MNTTPASPFALQIAALLADAGAAGLTIVIQKGAITLTGEDDAGVFTASIGATPDGTSCSVLENRWAT